jgi:hypothetical protein
MDSSWLAFGAAWSRRRWRPTTEIPFAKIRAPKDAEEKVKTGKMAQTG